ncbi:ornithine decarboxylase-like [Nymphaea colorata]|nr:ornithine decarboxylase-like [Nymphaea colorata]
MAPVMEQPAVRANGVGSKGLQAILSSPGVRGRKVTSLGATNKATNQPLLDLIQSIAMKQEQKDPFYVLDMGVVLGLWEKWNESLPMVKPFYAVKCNPEPALLSGLAALGANFDCASRAEIEAVLALGVSADRIVYANPCKSESHIRYAAGVGVNLTTYDSKEEVEKLRKLHPRCGLLLRIKGPDDGEARCPLGPKYGALPEEVVPLLQAAHAACLPVVGVSFHVGSGATQSRAYSAAIAFARSVFDTAERLGLPRMRVLNIGGGFTFGPQFAEASATIRAALKTHFPAESGVTFISEPGRFFAETAFTLATNIIGKRVRGELREYWINDGIYGSMNCLLYDHATITAQPLACWSNRVNPTCAGMGQYTSTVFGPTCDALDTVLSGVRLPELYVNDWVVFPNMGAYTAAAGSSFNGFNTAAIPTHVAYSLPPP